MRNLIVIAGPTASGKTAAAIALAKHFGTEIVSADARQFYREIPIGTAAPTPAELAEVPHHLVGQLSIHDHYDAGIFAEEVIALLAHLFLRHEHVIMTGGSGLFIKAVTDGFDALPEVPAEIREEVRVLYSTHGLVRLQHEVQQRDPAYFAMVDQQNPQRLMRALEICLATHKPYSDFRKQQPVTRAFSCTKLCIDIPRDTLYDRIEKRTDAMMASGWVEEAKAVYPYRHVSALQTVGYKELFAHFDGAYDLVTATDLIKQRTRNYAKRQLTWFRNTGGYHMVTDIQASLIERMSKAHGS
jgi:tRNA dimethylallyltransferase